MASTPARLWDGRWRPRAEWSASRASRSAPDCQACSSSRALICGRWAWGGDRRGTGGPLRADHFLPASPGGPGATHQCRQDPEAAVGAGRGLLAPHGDGGHAAAIAGTDSHLVRPALDGRAVSAPANGCRGCPGPRPVDRGPPGLRDAPRAVPRPGRQPRADRGGVSPGTDRHRRAHRRSVGSLAAAAPHPPCEQGRGPGRSAAGGNEGGSHPAPCSTRRRSAAPS